MMRELRYAARTFRREPAFVAGVVATFAIVIGTNAAMFGLVQRLMLAPPPGVEDAPRVARIGMTFASDDGTSITMQTTSYPVYRALSALGGAFAGVMAAQADSVTTGRGADLTEVAAVQATGDYFATLGVRPALGRLLDRGDDELPNGNDVVVLSYSYWQRRFGGDAGAIGQQLIVDEQPLTIVGVTPRGFNGTELAPVDLFIPLTTAFRKRGAGWWGDAGIRIVSVFARLRDGVTPASAGAMALPIVRAALDGMGPDRLTALLLESIVPGKTTRQSPQAQIALWLSGVSLVVLLIATANVGTLLLLRAARRRRDAAVRLALGASRLAIARQVLVECVGLALAGCLLGLLLARWLAELIRVTLLPTVAATSIANPTVLLASLAAACAAGLLAGLGPIAQLGSDNLAGELRTGGGHGASRRFRFQHALLGLQVALSTVLLIGAGLFVRSLRQVRSQDLGFPTARLLYVRLDFQSPVPAAERDLAHEDAVRRIATLAGIAGVTVVQGMPFSSHSIPPINVPGLPGPPNVGGQIPILYGATPAYLEMMDVRLREGRLFTDTDRATAPLVVLVNETMARTVWPGQSAIGKCVKAGFGGDLGMGDPMALAALTPCREVVGVVRDSRARSLRTEGNYEARLMQYYIPFEQLPRPPFPDAAQIHGILVRTAGDPDRAATAVQRVIQATSRVPVYARVRPYQSFIDPQLRSWRIGATLFSAFGLLALGIAGLGLFAVVSYLVAQRTPEIGVRLALGGSGVGVARLVVRDAVRMTAFGGGVGVAMALAAAPLVQPMLFRTSAREPLSMVVAVGVLLAVAVAAAAVPAWRAGRVSPMVVLRGDG